MPILLARARPDDGPPGPVHAYRITSTQASLIRLTAICGHCLDSAEYVEQVDEFDGLPCTPCLLLTLAQRDRDRENIEEPRIGVPAPPTPPLQIIENGHYAIDVRGESLVHFVAPRAPRSRLDGGQAVHTFCGALGFGPLPEAEIPVDWPSCEECRGLDN